MINFANIVKCICQIALSVHEQPCIQYKVLCTCLQEHVEDLLSVQREEMQRAAHDSQRQHERRVRHAQSALQTLMDDMEETGPSEDPQQSWRLVTGQDHAL